MKSTIYLFIVCALYVLTLTESGAQVSPYALSPDWYFGTGGRLTFPNGNYPTSGTPTPGSMPTNTSNSVEASTSICFGDGNVAFYTNTMQAYNANPANAAWTDFIRNFSIDNTCAGSSTGGGVAFPDPVSPTNAFYLIIANDLTSGGCANQGVNRYRFTGTGTAVTYNAGPTNIAPTSFAGEAIAAGSDGTGGYWVVVHSKSTANTFRVWHYTSSGITGPTDYTIGAAVSDVSFSQSYLKFSPCQDKIAYHSGGILVVNNFNRTTGVVGTELLRITPVNFGVGLEFSPDGNRVFYSGQGSIVNYVDIGSGTLGSVAGSASWSMQLGPDGKIYTSPGNSTNTIGIINNPNGSPSYSTTTLPGSATIFRGLTNITWLNPSTPTISNSIGCPIVNFGYDFRNYFNAVVGMNTSSIEWDFGEGAGYQTGLGTTPSHTYASTSGTFTVQMRINDATCNQQWLATKSITLSCPAPVSLIDFSAKQVGHKTLLTWNTASEENNDYFEIQRSDDGISFYTIGKVNGNGTTPNFSSYTFVDESVYTTSTYYRLLQYDTDGTINSLPIVQTIQSGTKDPAPTVTPNPSNDVFTITAVKMTEIIVTDLTGKVVEKITGTNMGSIQVGSLLSKGTYIITILDDASQYHYKVIKE